MPTMEMPNMDDSTARVRQVRASARALRAEADRLRWKAAEARFVHGDTFAANCHDAHAWALDARADLLELVGWTPGAEEHA
jgi:hypothetical protein